MSSAESRFDHEVVSGIAITVLATILAITDLAAARFGDMETALYTERASTYAWSGQKTVELSVERGRKLLLEALLESGTIDAAASPALRETLEYTDTNIERLQREREEIELGSVAVGEGNWSVVTSGGLGKVEGAGEQRRELGVLARAADRFGLAQVFIQIGLVLGAIALVFKGPGFKWRFFQLMCLLGAVGVFFSAWAYAITLGI